jgi:hypothetical protein
MHGRTMSGNISSALVPCMTNVLAFCSLFCEYHSIGIILECVMMNAGYTVFRVQGVPRNELLS